MLYLLEGKGGEEAVMGCKCLIGVLQTGKTLYLLDFLDMKHRLVTKKRF